MNKIKTVFLLGSLWLALFSSTARADLVVITPTMTKYVDKNVNVGSFVSGSGTFEWGLYNDFCWKCVGDSHVVKAYTTFNLSAIPAGASINQIILNYSASTPYDQGADVYSMGNINPASMTDADLFEAPASFLASFSGGIFPDIQIYDAPVKKLVLGTNASADCQSNIGALNWTLHFYSTSVVNTINIQSIEIYYNPVGPKFQSDFNSINIAGNFNGWNTTRSPLVLISNGLWKTAIPIPIGTNAFKFVSEQNWSASNWGDNDQSGANLDISGTADLFSGNNITFDLVGNNAQCSFVFNEVTREYSVIKEANASFNFMTIAGDFNNWNVDELLMVQISTNIWKANVFLPPGINQFKFVANKSWAQPSWGETNQSQSIPDFTQTADAAIGSNIIVNVKTSGTFTVTFNDTTLAYSVQTLSMNPIQRMSVAGSVNGWSTTANPMIEISNGVWQSGYILIEKYTYPAFKFVANESWDDHSWGELEFVSSSTPPFTGVADRSGVYNIPVNGDENRRVKFVFNLYSREYSVDQVSSFNTAHILLSLGGTFNGWNDTDYMSPYGENLWVKKITLTNGIHEFKFVSGSWGFGSVWGDSDQTDQSPPLNQSAELNSNASNMTVSVVEAGDYHFLFNTGTLQYQIMKAPLDTDLDGMSDDWESNNLLDIFNSVDATLDVDNDHVTAQGEFIADTDPHNQASVLKSSIERAGSDLQVVWPVSRFRMYNLELADFSQSLTMWNTVPGFGNISGTNAVNEEFQFVLPSDSATNTGVYRISVRIP